MPMTMTMFIKIVIMLIPSRYSGFTQRRRCSSGDRCRSRRVGDGFLAENVTDHIEIHLHLSGHLVFFLVLRGMLELLIPAALPWRAGDAPAAVARAGPLRLHAGCAHCPREQMLPPARHGCGWRHGAPRRGAAAWAGGVEVRRSLEVMRGCIYG